MKKFFTLLFAFSAICSASLFAQCNPEFTFTVNGNTGLVQFSPVSTNAVVRHNWSFGDGSSSSFAAPSHIYAPGVYNVVHVAIAYSPNDSTIAECIDSAVRTITVMPPVPCDVHASFAFRRDSIQTNKVYFTNLSTGGNPNTITQWSFGDGTGSFDASPTHIFATSGVYRVCLTVKRDEFCISDTCAMVQVQAPNNCNLTVNFSSTPETANPGIIRFTNLSTPLSPADSVTWVFGDGNVSNDANPIHTYAGSGSYSVCLIVKKVNSAGGVECIREQCRVILVQSPCNIVPRFEFVRDSSVTAFPASYRFYNTTTGLSNVDSSFWDFGDNSPVVFNPNNPVMHVYAAPGVYTVCLRVKKVQPGTINIICERQNCQTIIVDTPQVQCNLQAYFSYRQDSANANKIYFTNQTPPASGADSLFWSFGDGSGSTLANPTHTYNVAGAYTVCLKVVRAAAGASCVSEYCKVVAAGQNTSCNLVASFTYRRDSISSLPIPPYIFQNTSMPLTTADSSFWDFGDGSPIVINPNNPVAHAYTSVGTYIVCLKVKKVLPGTTNIICERQTCQTIVVANNANVCNQLQVAFNWRTDSTNSNKIQFINQSSPVTANTFANWSFGDGDSSMAYSPTHIYAQPGTYRVCLTMRLGNVCVKDTCQTIVVQGSVNPCSQLQVNFTWATDSFNNRKIYFNNQSSPLTANTYTQWSFGDGTSSTAYSPGHIYTQPGTYRVCLRMGILGTNCVKDTCQTIVVLPGTVDSCNIQPNFAYRTAPANMRKVFFENTTVTPSSGGYAVWSFGDGTTGTGWHADHIYQQPGWYLVCLSITLNNTCTRTHCDSVFVPGNVIPPVNCDSFQLQFAYRRDNYMPNKLYFTATGNAPVYNQQWSVTKAGDSSAIFINQNNPLFVFPDTGLYIVCVKAAFSTNCTKEYCDEVRIYNTIPPTQCVLAAYPNPAHNAITYNVQLNQASVITSVIYNMQGIALMQYTQTGAPGNNPVTLNVQNLVPGFYTVRILYNGQVCYTRFQKI